MGILAEADRRILERIGYGNGRRGSGGPLSGKLPQERRGERSPKMPAGACGSGGALWMARGCQAVGRYDDHVLAAAWLERARPGKRAGIRRLGRQQVRRRAGVFRGVQIRRRKAGPPGGSGTGEWPWLPCTAGIPRRRWRRPRRGWSSPPTPPWPGECWGAVRRAGRPAGCPGGGEAREGVPGGGIVRRGGCSFRVPAG